MDLYSIKGQLVFANHSKKAYYKAVTAGAIADVGQHFQSLKQEEAESKSAVVNDLLISSCSLMLALSGS